jgi:hypothetical protein
MYLAIKLVEKQELQRKHLKADILGEKLILLLEFFQLQNQNMF